MPYPCKSGGGNARLRKFIDILKMLLVIFLDSEDGTQRRCRKFETKKFALHTDDRDKDFDLVAKQRC